MWRVSILAVPIAVAVMVATGEWWAGPVTGVGLVVVFLVAKAGIIVVPERKAAVIRNRLQFYIGLRGPGWGFILPLWEHVATYLDLGPKSAKFAISGIRSRDRLPVTIPLSFFYRLSPWDMKPELRSHLIDNLERLAPAILQRHVEHLLHRLVGQQGISSLLQPEVRGHLEDRLAKELPHQVKRLGIFILGEVMLGSIALPDAVQAEINLAQQARIQVEARTDVLNALREALGTQPDGVWEKVIEVEAIGALARNGVPAFFPYSTAWDVWAFGGRADGKSRNGNEL